MKMLKRIFYFIVVFFVLDFFVGFSCDYLLGRSKWGYIAKDIYCLNKMEADFLILGSSRAEYHYVSKIIQDSCLTSTFNAGCSGCGIYYSYAMLRAILDRYTPKYILFDIHDTDLTLEGKNNFTKNGVLSTLMPYTRINSSVREFYQDNSSCLDILLLSCNSYCYNSTILNLLSANLIYTPIMENLGYMKHTSFKKDLKVKTPSSDKINIDEDKLKIFHNFISLAKENRVQLIVCYSPSYDIQDLQKDSLIRSIVDQYGVPYYSFAKNASDVINYEFADENHLKHEGACTYTKELIPILKREFNLE